MCDQHKTWFEGYQKGEQPTPRKITLPKMKITT